MPRTFQDLFSLAMSWRFYHSSIQIRVCGAEAAMPHLQTWRRRESDTHHSPVSRLLSPHHHSRLDAGVGAAGLKLDFLHISIITIPSTPAHFTISIVWGVAWFLKGSCGMVESSQNIQNGARTVEIKYSGVTLGHVCSAFQNRKWKQDFYYDFVKIWIDALSVGRIKVIS